MSKVLVRYVFMPVLLLILLALCARVYMTASMEEQATIQRDPQMYWGLPWRSPTATPTLRLYQVNAAGVRCWVLETDAGTTMDCEADNE